MILVVIKVSYKKPFEAEYLLFSIYMVTGVLVSSLPTLSVFEIRGRFSRRDDIIYERIVHIQGRWQYSVIFWVI